MNKNFLPVLALVLIIGFAMAACAKKQEPNVQLKEVESVPASVDNNVGVTAAKDKDVDEDIFDLDKIPDEAPQVAGTADKAVEDAGVAAEGLSDDAALLEGTLDETAKTAVTSTTTQAQNVVEKAKTGVAETVDAAAKTDQ